MKNGYKMPSNHLFIFLLLILNINSFLIGYLAGRQRNHNVSLENSDYKIFRNKKQQLETQLWNIANTLRGKMDADDFRDYILGFIFYK